VDDASALHDWTHAANSADLTQGIAVYGHQVGQQAFTHRAQAIVHAEESRSCQGGVRARRAPLASSHAIRSLAPLS
jgi:hypothetical protein